MKISFVVGKLPITPVSTWGEIRKYTEQGLSGFSLEDYWRIRGLEINPYFETEILATRKKLGIPQSGLEYEEYLKYHYSEQKLNKVDFEVERIIKEYNCDNFIKRQIKPILLANIALPSYPNMNDFGEISIQTIFDEDDLNEEDYTKNEKVVNIRITSQVSADRVMEFIKDRRSLLNKQFKQLPKKNKFTLTEEKVKIYSLKTKNKMSPLAISMKLVEDTNENPKPVKTIESILTRVEEDINSLFYKNPSK